MPKQENNDNETEGQTDTIQNATSNVTKPEPAGDTETSPSLQKWQKTLELVLPDKQHPMELLLKNAGGIFLSKVGDLVEGTILEKKGTRLFVDLGPRGVGIIYGREYYAAQDLIKGLQPGDPLNAKIVETDNEENYVELSLKDAGEEKRWIDLKKIMQTGETLELPVLEANRGGLILESRGIKGFLPASQLSSKNYPRVDGGDKEKIYLELQKLIGRVIKVKILDLDLLDNKLIFTEKELDQGMIRKLLAKYKIGDTVDGEITGVVDFGAFLKLDESGIEGLIHISEIDWTLIEDPREVLKPGDRVKAKIIDIQGDRVSLSLKALKENPWPKISEKYQKGDIVRGKITKFNPFGVFVRLDQDFHGLIHISEFGNEENMRKELELGKEYDLKILLIDPTEHRLSLGMIRKQIETPAADTT